MSAESRTSSGAEAPGEAELVSPFNLRPRKYVSYVVGKSTFKIDARYTNLRPIGSGSYGVVCSADDRYTGRQVAIKKISNVFEDLVDAKRILREMKLLRHLGMHENVISIYDLVTMPAGTRDFNELYLVTELFECDLDRIISSSQPLTEGHKQYFLYQILRALKFIHSAEVLHRDLKPLNILVNANCDLAICDFGLARGIPEGEESKMTEYVVTRWYRAPELLCDNAAYDKKVDVWSVGCIFAEILGRRPLLKGKDYLAQLQLIIDLLGPPSREDTEFIVNPDARAAIRAMRPTRPVVSLRERFPDATEGAINILSRMLVFNPTRRATVAELLAHPYLADIHREEDEPLCDKLFNFDYEKDYPDEMPKRLLQELMFSESMVLRQQDHAMRVAAAAAAASAAGTGASGGGAAGSGATAAPGATASASASSAAAAAPTGK